MHARNALCLLALLALAPSSLADVVHLRGGGQLVGRATVKGDEVLVEFEGGSMTFPRAKVVRIERTELSRNSGLAEAACFTCSAFFAYRSRAMKGLLVS